MQHRLLGLQTYGFFMLSLFSPGLFYATLNSFPLAIKQAFFLLLTVYGIA